MYRNMKCGPAIKPAALMPRAVLLVVMFCFPAFVSCAQGPGPVAFSVLGIDQTLFGSDRSAVRGILDFSEQRRLDFNFAGTPSVPRLVSFEISYSFVRPLDAASGRPGRVILEFGGNAWALPLPPAGKRTIMHYAIPADSLPDKFSIYNDGDVDGERQSRSPVLQIHSVDCKERWFGYYRYQDSLEHLFISPFVYERQDGSWVIDPPAEFGVPANGEFVIFSAILPGGSSAAFYGGNLWFEAVSQLERFSIPAGIITPDTGPFVFYGDPASSFRLAYAGVPAFPAPLTADPGMVLDWPREKWRNRRYEVFRWDRFPSLLIIDFADYAVQDRMLRRLSFYVEKADYRGSILTDDELTRMYGWEAYDFRAVDLARFFQTCRETNFPLLAEERELEKILLDTGVIRESGGRLREGQGGVISVSRDSAQWERTRYMAHEGFHGLFFIDEDFRNFSRQRWQNLPAGAKRFIRSFFDYRRYDITDEYLLVNEFMGHILQLPVSHAGWYFGSSLPSRLEGIPRHAMDLPEKDRATGTWPFLERAFAREALAFSGYVAGRWRLETGRVGMVTIRRP
jgi:hypothetical protein